MRRKRSGKTEFIAIIAGIVFVLVILGSAMLRAYSQRIDRQLFNASSTSIEDTYAEAILVFDELTTSRWNYLEQMALYMNAVDPGDAGDEALARTYVGRLQELYGFTGFLLVNDSGQYITVEGKRGYADFGNALFDLIDDGERIVTDGSLPGRENIFFYAVPCETHTYQGFEYCAVAFAYDKQDLSSVMDLTAYNGESDAYLVYPNGRVCITMGEVRYEVRNVLSDLEAIGVDETLLAEITQDLQDGATDTVTIERDGVDYYLSYQATGLSDWRLVSLTPTDVVDRDINIVRSSTTNMMLALGSMLLTLVLAVGVYWAWRNMRDMDSMLAEREMIFLTLSEHMDEIYLLYDDEQGAVQYVSPNVERLLGVTTQEIYNVPGTLTRRVVEQDSWNNRAAIDALQPGERIHRDYHMTNRATGETRPYALDLYRSDDARHPHTLIMSLTDSSREYAVRAEITAAMESAQAANEAKSSFLSSMSHDIRTPMNAIIGFTTLLDRNADQPELVHEYTAKIRTSGNHLLGLIGDILDISKIESGKVTINPEEVRLYEVADHVMDLIRSQAEAKGQSLTLQFELPQDARVMVDRLRLTQILQNLLSNATKYTQNGGDIVLRIDKDKDKDKGIYTSYRFVVRDNGMGMSEEFQQKVFQPFTREVNSTVNKIQGTGLGMSITKSIVDMMGGTIGVVSQLGEGSTFTVELPLREVKNAAGADVAGTGVSGANAAGTDAANVAGAGANGAAGSDTSGSGTANTAGTNAGGSETANAASAADAEKVAYSIEGLRILAAEDNEINAEILEALLDMDGATCKIVHNGKEALEAFEAAAPGQYDLILMDVQMPIMNGYDATRAIRASVVNAEGARIPIVAMTANAFSEDVRDALDAGMNAHLAKPMNMDALRQTAGELVAAYRQQH